MMVSIIVPVYKVEMFIRRCAESLFSQTLADNVEYIFVDDGSPDNSIAILQEVLDQFPKRKMQVKILYHDKNQGNAAARNTGLNAATGDYVIQVDSDDWLEPDMIEKMYHQAKEVDADMVVCNCVEEFENKQKINRFPQTIGAKELIEGIPCNLHYAVLWNKLIKRSLYTNHQILCFDGANIWVDIGVTMRLCFFAKRIAIEPQILYHYNRRNENAVSHKTSIKKINGKIICAENLRQFFIDQGVEKEYALTIQYLLYLSKDRLLYDRSVRDFLRWKSLFPDTHAFIWRFPKLTLFKRVVFSLAAYGCPGFAILLLNVRASLND